MNDEHENDPDLDPAQDARIRALLAELGSGPDGEPLPPEVAARLDDTLALLVAERSRAGGARSEDETTADNVVPLRRRWLPRAAVAAAAVIVLGAGGVFVANLGQMSGTGLSSSSDSADKSTAEGQESGGGSSSDSESGTGASLLPDLSAASFESDVTVLLQGRASMLSPDGRAAEEGDAADEPSPDNRDSAKSGAPYVPPSRACPGPKITDGAVPRQVIYDNRPAVLLVHPERGGRVLVEAWNCDGDRRLASTKIKP